MNIRRSIAAASVAVIAATAAGAGAQDAVPPGHSRAAAASTALELSLFGQALTFGDNATSTVSAAPLANAVGTGLLIVDAAQGAMTASSTADGQTTGSADPVCGQLALPPEVPALDLTTGCSSALASITGGNPAAVATAEVASLGVQAVDVLDLAAPLEDNVEGGVDQVLTGLAPVFDGLADAGLDVDSLIRDLLDAITDGGNLLTVTLGPSSSDIVTDATSVTAAADAQGAVITVLDRSLLAVPLPPVLTIEGGAAGASAAADRGTGAAAPVVTPSLVRITIAEDIATALMLPENVIDVAPGQTIDIPLPDPLASRIVVANGTTATDPDGTARAEAAGVRLELLTGLPDGGIVLNLAEASAEVLAVAAAAPEAPPIARSAPDPAPDDPRLARTGPTGVAVLPALLVAGAALGLLRLTRRRTA